MRVLAALLVLSSGCSSCGGAPDSPASAPATREEPVTLRQEGSPNVTITKRVDVTIPEGAGGASAAGGLRWAAPEMFERVPPSSPMRAAEYVVTMEGAAPASLGVFFFGPGQGGSVQDNVDRWVGQFTQPDGRASSEVAQIAHRDVNGVPVTTVDVTGLFSAGAGPMAGHGGGEPVDSRMLAAIVEGPRGMVFFKLTGPRDVVTRAEHAFAELVESIAPQ
jgi:hypothetical protein